MGNVSETRASWSIDLDPPDKMSVSTFRYEEREILEVEEIVKSVLGKETIPPVILLFTRMWLALSSALHLTIQTGRADSNGSQLQ